MGDAGRRFWLVPVFALSISLSLAIGWFTDGRSPTSSFWLNEGIAAVGALVAALATKWLVPNATARPFSSRFATAFVLLAVISACIICCGLTLAIGLQPDALPERWTRTGLFYWSLISAGTAVYTFLVIEARLLLPLGIPSLVVFSALFARRRR
ncbi:hypothetical protein SAMN05216548_102317 [Faunimonas pinastri]|uniref:Uncharacterized protein n=1 Tax=Faunimonas pinastri TaxID=1855383 RepID=A0A1H9D132_9HYPH|nr:hypothetical protein [Faunimonas pinastri]SEQ07196.1 hypothetical protein SAMN05216548_102317 [Faunimonas pinastri]